MNGENRIAISRVKKDFSASELDNPNWQNACEVEIDKYWSGETAPVGRRFTAQLLWSEAALYVRFCASQTEPLIVSIAPNLETKTIGLWDRDVCEIFVAPSTKEPHRYFEFEVAPTGEWIDLHIHLTGEKREADFDYQSGMQTAARIETDKVLMAIKIDWKKAFGKAPKTGDAWRGNLFRCVGAGDARGYLAWQPTKTEKPNFHVAEAFGEFHFINGKW